MAIAVDVNQLEEIPVTEARAHGPKCDNLYEIY